MEATIEQALSSADGENVISFVPDNSRAIALVDLDTLKRLLVRLGSTSFFVSRDLLIEKLKSTTTMNEMLSVIDDELAFRATIKLVEEHSKSTETKKSQASLRNVV